MRARRDLPAGVVGAASARAVPLAAQAEPVSPDAALLPLPAQLAAARAAYRNKCCPDEGPEKEALWRAFDSIHDVCLETPAVTLDGLIAKARMARQELESENLDGSIPPHSSIHELLARNIVDDLLRLAGAGA